MSNAAMHVKAGRIASLDGFRGLAILMVTVFRFGSHAFTEDVIGRLPSKLILIGAAGVDFFFVLSGFLITGLLGEVSEKSFTLFRMDGLLLGAIASVIYQKRHLRIDALTRIRWDICLAVLIVCYVISLPLADRDYTIRYSIVSLLATCLLLSTLASNPESWQRRLMETGWLRSLGKFSYAMYIFQGPLIP